MQTLVYNNLSEREIINLAKTDKGAQQQIIIKYKSLVYKIALSYVNIGLNSNFDLEDLIQEGYMGLLEAIKYYDNEQNVKFITYAHKTIRRYIMRKIDKNGNIVKTPINYEEDKRKFQKKYTQLTQEKGANPTVEELVIYMNLSKDEIIDFLNSPIVASLDAELCDSSDNNCSLYDILPSDENVEKTYDKKELIEIIKYVIEKLNLNKNEKAILKYRLLIEKEPVAFNTIIQKEGLNISWQRMQKIEAALKIKLSKIPELQELYELTTGKTAKIKEPKKRITKTEQKQKTRTMNYKKLKELLGEYPEPVIKEALMKQSAKDIVFLDSFIGHEQNMDDENNKKLEEIITKIKNIIDDIHLNYFSKLSKISLDDNLISKIVFNSKCLKPKELEYLKYLIKTKKFQKFISNEDPKNSKILEELISNANKIIDIDSVSLKNAKTKDETINILYNLLKKCQMYFNKYDKKDTEETFNVPQRRLCLNTINNKYKRLTGKICCCNYQV